MRNDLLNLTSRKERLSRPSRTILTLIIAVLTAGLITACGTAPSQADASDTDIIMEYTPGPATAALQSRPLESASVQGTITVLLRSQPRVTSASFYLDDWSPNATPVHTTDAAPHLFEIDTTTLSDGSHTLTAVAEVSSDHPNIASSENPRNARATFNVRNHPVSGPVPTPSNRYAVPPATLYVATNGNDSNTGLTENEPLRTIGRAANIAQAGDTIYIRGGIYPIQVAFTRSGTNNQPITWTSYPGETAILDGSNQTPVDSNDRVWVTNVRHNVFANLEIRNSPREGIILQNSHDNLFTHLEVHSNHYSGILVIQSDRNRFQYLTTHNNYDQHNPDGRIGDDADGISISTGDANVLYRVIAYNNSDDGIDAWRSTNTIIDSSVSFDNGRGSHGDGNGFKAGGNADDNRTIVRNSLAFNNRSNGFDDNNGRNITYVNNTAHANGGYDYAFGDTATLRNNLSLNGSIGIWGSDHHYNNWNLGITDARVISTDPQNPDFLALQTDSPARNAGTTTHGTTSTDLGAIPYGQTIASITTYSQPTQQTAYASTNH